MPGRVLLYTTSGISIGVLLLLSAINGHFPKSASGWLSPISMAVTASGVLLWLFDRRIWRLPGLARLSGRPDLHGTWHGTLASTWIDQSTGLQAPPDDDVFLVVRQRYWQVNVRLLTRESSSASEVANVVADTDGVQHLVWVYSNSPRAGVRHRSELHRGAASLVAQSHARPPRIEGTYFTDRRTLGDLAFAARYRQLVTTHAEGQALVTAPPHTCDVQLWRPKTWFRGRNASS